MSARDRLQRNRVAGNCQLCFSFGHISDRCKLAECTKCEGKGHVAENCPTNGSVRSVTLLLPHGTDAMLGASTRCIRDRHLMPMMPYLSEWRETTVRNTVISADGSQISLSCSATASIAMSIQELNGVNETLLRIQPRRIKIAGKYTIENGELTENIAGKASGGTHMNSPDADVHILLLLQSVDGQTIGLNVNGHRFLMNWRSVVEQGHERKLVHVSTMYGYNAFNELRQRPAIPSLKNYFNGLDRAANPAPVEPAVETSSPAESIKIEEQSDEESDTDSDEFSDAESVSTASQMDDDNGADYLPLERHAVVDIKPEGDMGGACSMSAAPSTSRVVNIEMAGLFKKWVEEDFMRKLHAKRNESQPE